MGLRWLGQVRAEQPLGSGLFGCHTNYRTLWEGLRGKAVDPGPGAQRQVGWSCRCKGADVWEGAILSQKTEESQAGVVVSRTRRLVSCSQMGGLSCPPDPEGTW